MCPNIKTYPVTVVLLDILHKFLMLLFLAHLSQRLIGELIVYEGIRRPSVSRRRRPT